MTALTENPADETPPTRSIRLVETAPATIKFMQVSTASPTRTPTSTGRPTRIFTNTATRTASATASASMTASSTLTRTPIRTLPLPATVTPTAIITWIVPPLHAGEDPQIGGISSTAQPASTLPVPLPPASIIPTSTPSLTPTFAASPTPSLEQPPTLAATIIVVTPADGAPGESQPPPGVEVGLTAVLPPVVVNPPSPVNPSPTPIDAGSRPPNA